MLLPALTLLYLLAACGSNRPELTPENPYWLDNDRKDIPEPASSDPNLIWQVADRTVFEQSDQLLDLDRSFRKIAGTPKQAWNINSVDEVPNSSWFTNRHHLHPMSADELRRGAVFSGGPDTGGVWTVYRPKVGGVTAGFWIKDAKGDAYIIKFDPPDNPELATSAAAMAGRFFYACGYNVPEETITSFHPDKLVIKDGVTWKDNKGVKHPFDRAKLEEILKLAHRNEDGSYRCLASLALPNVKGPFSFDGVREDDPNDWCKHEHRRELRALYVFCSFVNHWDIKDQNSMDIYDERDGRRFLSHYLLDFGSTLGSAGHSAQNPRSGYTNQFDLRDAMVSLVTFGLKTWPWERAKPYEYPSVGYFESEIFHPAKWDPIYPIPAFENMTDRDAYWAAKIVMSFRDDDLRALIHAGQLSNPEARRYLFETLQERRDKIGRYWFSKVNPLDYFELSQGDNGLTLSCRDLAVEYGLNDSAVSRYEVLYDGEKIVRGEEYRGNNLMLGPDEVAAMARAFANNSQRATNLFEVRIRSRRDGGNWTKPVVVWLWYHPDASRFQLVGVEHLD